MSATPTTTARYYDTKAPLYGISTVRFEKIKTLLSSIKNSRILDIGCANGYVGGYFKSKGNYVVGFDISKKAITHARRTLDNAFVVDLENDPLPRLKPFDVLILSEIVEHLFQPEQTVQRLIKYLKPKGLLLITTPNIMYWGNRIQFLKGKFTYEKQGHFDESHVHFFTDETIRILLTEKLKLRIKEESHIGAGQLGSFLASKFPGLFAYQLVFVAQK